MTATAFSQKPIIRKATIDGENGFIANEVVMDSIMEVHYSFIKSQITNESLNINLELLQKKLEKLNLQVDFYVKDNSRLQLQISSLKNQMTFMEKSHEIDLLYYKEKSNNWLSTFLYGTTAGGLIVTLIIILGQ